jgi:hypothetical protein
MDATNKTVLGIAFAVAVVLLLLLVWAIFGQKK